jgi:hypothetical protein
MDILEKLTVTQLVKKLPPFHFPVHNSTLIFLYSIQLYANSVHLIVYFTTLSLSMTKQHTIYQWQWVMNWKGHWSNIMAWFKALSWHLPDHKRPHHHSALFKISFNVIPCQLLTNGLFLPCSPIKILYSFLVSSGFSSATAHMVQHFFLNCRVTSTKSF